MHVYLSYLSRSVCRAVFRPVPAAKRDPSSLNRDPSRSGTIFTTNTSSRFAWTILCWLCKSFHVKSSLVETCWCKPGMKNVPSRQTCRLPYTVHVYTNRKIKNFYTYECRYISVGISFERKLHHIEKMLLLMRHPIHGANQRASCKRMYI